MKGWFIDPQSWRMNITMSNAYRPRVGDELLATLPSGYRFCYNISKKSESNSPVKVRRDMLAHRGVEHGALLRAVNRLLDGGLPDDLK
jgi:hypothetical protein